MIEAATQHTHKAELLTMQAMRLAHTVLQRARILQAIVIKLISQDPDIDTVELPKVKTEECTCFPISQLSLNMLLELVDCYAIIV